VELLGEITAFLTDPASYQGRFALQQLLWQHIWYSVAAMAVASAIALPLGLWIGHRGRGELLVVTATNTGRAVPDFGIILIALLLLGLGALPVVIALTALAIPPMLINAYVGVRQVEPGIRDAAFGMGMTGRQVLRRVELPVAVPLIMTGIRTAAVQVVATATLAGAIGGGGFGRLIFDALRVGFAQGRARMVVASVAVAILAILTEVGLGRVERALTPRGLRQEADPGAEDQLAPHLTRTAS
jgi:osmoprotectant transport system permease protein